MILVADSGSTKTDWALLSKGQEVKQFVTAGFNPFYFSKASLAEAMASASELDSIRDEPVEILFYGAGCSDAVQNAKVRHALEQCFPNQRSIEVENDLMGSVMATAHYEAGICCILGTGSNACYFDGQKMHQNTPSLGLYLGDEGSAGFLCKRLLRQYFYHQLPSDLQEAFKEKYHLSKDECLDRIYGQPKPNTYVAGFFPFLVEHKDHEYVSLIVRNGFEEFICNHVLCYPESSTVKIHFIGSVAFLFQDILQKSLTNHGLHMGAVHQKPMDGIIENISRRL